MNVNLKTVIMDAVTKAVESAKAEPLGTVKDKVIKHFNERINCDKPKCENCKKAKEIAASRIAYDVNKSPGLVRAIYHIIVTEKTLHDLAVVIMSFKEIGKLIPSYLQFAQTNKTDEFKFGAKVEGSEQSLIDTYKELAKIFGIPEKQYTTKLLDKNDEDFAEAFASFLSGLFNK